MALTCQLARVSYLALYEELASDRGFRAAVENRLEDLGTTTLDELVGAYRDRKSTRLNSSHSTLSRMPSSA